MRRSLAMLVLVLAWLPGCKRDNALYCCTEAATCGDAPMRECTDPLFPTCDNVTHECTGATRCEGTGDCTMAEAPVCDGTGVCGACADEADCSRFTGTPHCGGAPADGACVACRPAEPADCGPDTPVCDPSSFACRGCQSGGECASGVCLAESGRCADEAQVAYVDDDAPLTNVLCTRAAPCKEIQAGVAVMRSGQLLPVVAVAPGMYASRVVIVRALRIVAEPGAILQPALNGVNGVDVSAGMDLGELDIRIEGLTIRQASSTALDNGFGLTCLALSGSTPVITLRDVVIEDNDAAGVSMQVSRCQLDLARGHIRRNGGGGVEVQTTFRIVNTALVGNRGDTWSAIRLRGTPAAGSTLAFLTVTGNDASDTGAAILCDAAGATVHSLIAWDNGLADVKGACDPTHSLLSDRAADPVKMNLNADPMFADAPDDLDLLPGSPARGTGRPNTGVLDDLEGRPRPAEAPHMGAYQTP
jgi:hypothetical protein